MNTYPVRIPRRGSDVRVSSGLESFTSIGLAELGAASLMRRTDTKFVFHASSLPAMLQGLEGVYRLLEVENITSHEYCTLYFDTPSLDLFHAHHRGSGHRFKVRQRKYMTTDQLFLEVKRRSNKGETNKVRALTERMDDVLDVSSSTVAEVMAASDLERATPLTGDLAATLWNSYRRVTLVRIDVPERVTFDTDLCFWTADAGKQLRGVAIAEVKQERVDRSSPVMERMRALGVRPGGFSKYCMGVSLITRGVKHNRFKPKLRALGQLMGGTPHVA